MNHPSFSRPTIRDEQRDERDTRLYGRWLVLLRVMWVVVVVLSVGLSIVSVPLNLATSYAICTAASCFNSNQLTLDQVHELQHLGLSIDFYATFNSVVTILFEFGYVVTGAVIFWRKSDERVALVTSLYLVTFGAAFEGFYVLLSLQPGLRVLSLGMALVGNICVGFFFFLFPTGHFAPRWTRWFLVVWIAYWGYTNVLSGSIQNGSGLIDAVVFFGLLVSVVTVQVYRYRRVSTPLQRQQTKWVVYGISVALGGLLLVKTLGFELTLHLGVIGYMVAAGLVHLFMLLIPLAIGIAMLRSRLFDIDLIINRTLVYGALTLSVIGLYVLVVVGLGTLIRVQGNVLLSLLATGIIAVLFQPLRLRLQRGVNHLMYGERDDPYAVLARLGSRLEAALVPEKVLPTVAETVAQALKLPYVAIALLPEQQLFTKTEVGTASVAGEREVDIVAFSGTPTADPMRVPLVYQAETIGYLLLAARSGDTFGKADSRLLTDLARQAGVAVYAVRLTTHLQQLTKSLQQARERLVTTREEERRRLRRDLHDGLGPALASLTFKVDAARNLLAQDSARAETLLAEVRQQAQAAIIDIRRLVYNLRPPALDELGLLSALREQVALYQHQGLEVTSDSPSSLPPLPAAVEVAVYRITQEALTNVARHARAQRCLLRLALDAEAVQLTISDDGQGIPTDHHIGIGLHAMHERASELGGSCVITQEPSGGTTIQVWLPRFPAKGTLPAFPQETEQPEQEHLLASDMSLVRKAE